MYDRIYTITELLSGCGRTPGSHCSTCGLTAALQGSLIHEEQAQQQNGGLWMDGEGLERAYASGVTRSLELLFYMKN